MKTALTLILCASLVGCATVATSYTPVIDTKGRDSAQMQVDLAECRQYALQLAGSAEKTAVGAVAGAIFGAIIMAAAGQRDFAAQGAAVGAVSGGMQGAVSGDRDQKAVINRCMSNRGYSVLN